MDHQTLLSGGRVVTDTEVKRADVLLDGERIAAVGPDLRSQASQAAIIDVSGLHIFPGLVDVHTHLREPGGEHKEDFTTGTQAALAGGVTTVFAMPNTDPPIIDRESFELAARLVEEKAVCDVGLFVGATPDNAAEAAALADRAVGLKMYMGSSTGSLLVDSFAAQLAHFEAFPRHRVLAVHAEDEEAVRHYAAQGQRRPPVCAALAVARAITLAEQTGRRLHICHVSTPHEIVLIQRVQDIPLTYEVCPHHIFLSQADEEALGPLGKVNPPLRARIDADRLYAQLHNLPIIATDHAPHTLAEKHSADPPSGMPGLETTMPLMLDAYHHGAITLPHIARITSANPAGAFDLRDRGHVAQGFRADLALVDLQEQWGISNDGLFTRCGWSPFAGRTVTGRVKQTFLRGKLVYTDGTIIADSGYGHLVTPH